MVAIVSLSVMLVLGGQFQREVDGEEIPGRKEPFSLVGLVHDDLALNRPHDVELQGNIAYVPGKGGSLAIIDVSDVTKPKLLSSLVGLEDAETVLPMGDVLLLGTRDFLAVDVSDPARPKIVTHISDRPRIDKINGMALRGDHVLAANKSGYRRMKKTMKGGGVVTISAPYKGGWVAAIVKK